MFVSTSNGDTLRADIFAFNTNHGIFISQNSLDDARERAYDYMIDNGFMTIAEREAAWRLNTQNSVINISPMFNSYANNVNGRMTWKDDNNKTHPLQFIRIEIRNATSILETTYTDINGYFSTNLNPTGQVNIRILPAGLNTGSASNVRVVRENSTEYYHEELNISYSSAFNREFDMTSDLGRAFQVSQATIVAARYARTMKGSFVPNVTVIYPHSNTGCSYSPGSSTMNITGNTAVSNGVRSYSSWDVIMHEYGHHVQHKAGYSIANNPAGSHSLTANLADSRSDKDIGIRLAWAESWPTFFGSVVQQYYINASELDSNITSIGDAQYTSYNGASLNYPNGTTVGGMTTYFNGEASESGVIGALWAIYTDTGKSWDNFSIGHQAIWNLVTGNTMHTFSAFANAFYTAYPQYRSEFGQIMANFRIAPSGATNTAVTATTPPTFSWIGNGGGANTYSRNNRYTIVFYNGNTEIFRTATITNTSTGTITHTLSTSDWNSVLNAAGSTIKVCVMAEQTSTPLTGGYFSQGVSFAKPAIYSFTTTTNSTGLKITGVSGNVPSNLEIPARINGTLVTQIGNGSSTVSGFASVTNITFATDSGVATIAASVFSGLTQLSQISIPASVTTIGDSAFANCTNLGSNGYAMYLPSSVTNIGSFAFNNCTNLTINIIGRTQVPSTFDTNWNNSNRPVMFNGILCNHTRYQYYSYDSSNHTRKCLDCLHRTTINHTFVDNGSYTICECGYKLCTNGHSLYYVPVYGTGTHYQRCNNCNYAGSLQNCRIMPGYPGEILYCGRCGQGTNLGILLDKITLLNGLIVDSNEELNFEEISLLFAEFGYEYLPYTDKAYKKKDELEHTYYK